MKANSADLAAVATSGDYSDLNNSPYIPTKTSDLVNDSNYPVDVNYVHTDNNYTTAEKEKLADIAAGAEVNVNADWNATSGDAQILNKPTNVSAFTNDVGYLTVHQDIGGKADKSEIPTKVSQLQNDSGYLTSFTETDPTVSEWAKATTKPSYTAAEIGAPTIQEMNTAIGNAIGNINSFDVAVVQELPTQNISTHTIYLVPKTGETNDVYDEYIYINNAWEMIGNTQIDLSDYALKSELPTKVSELSNDSGYLTSYTETDPTVPQWAKATTKPSYTAAEVGALPSDTHIPSTTAELTNDAGFITSADVPTKISDLTDDSGHYIKPETGIPASDLEEEIISTIDGKASTIWNSASGVIASFPDGAESTAKKLVVGIEPVQEGTGDPSPDNVRPISGWTGAKVTRTGKNLLNESVKTQSATYVFFNSTGDASEKTMTLPAGTYTISVSYTGTVKAHINVYRMNPYERITVAYLATRLTFTLTKTEEILLWMQNSDFSIQDIGTIQLELGSTATTYEPYQGETYDITFPSEAGTVYGGTLDVTNGVLTVEKYGIVVNGSNHRFEKQGNYWHITPYDYPTIKIVSGGTAPVLVYSDITLGRTKWGTTQNGTQMFTRAADWTGVFNSVDELNAIDITVVYELAAPLTYQLTPQEITTLLGQNNIWADTGDMSVTYRADTKLYIDNKITQAIAAALNA